MFIKIHTNIRYSSKRVKTILANFDNFPQIRFYHVTHPVYWWIIWLWNASISSLSNLSKVPSSADNTLSVFFLTHRTMEHEVTPTRRMIRAIIGHWCLKKPLTNMGLTQQPWGVPVRNGPSRRMFSPLRLILLGNYYYCDLDPSEELLLGQITLNRLGSCLIVKYQAPTITINVVVSVPEWIGTSVVYSMFFFAVTIVRHPTGSFLRLQKRIQSQKESKIDVLNLTRTLSIGVSVILGVNFLNFRNS